MLLEAGVPEAYINDGTVDPQVKIDADGKKGSLFDALEDMDTADCIAKVVELEALRRARSALRALAGRLKISRKRATRLMLVPHRSVHNGSSGNVYATRA